MRQNRCAGLRLRAPECGGGSRERDRETERRRDGERQRREVIEVSANGRSETATDRLSQINRRRRLVFNLPLGVLAGTNHSRDHSKAESHNESY
jgi:hypothetical protein